MNSSLSALPNLNMSVRDNRAAELMVHLAAQWIAREAGRQTLITPKRADISPDRKNATIFVSVFPDGEQEHAITYLTRNRDDFRSFLRKEGKWSVLPFIKFEFDYGEQNRQHVDTLASQT